MDDGFFAGGIGIDIGPHILHPGNDMVGLPAFGPLKKAMFHEMAQAGSAGIFVA